MLNVNAVVFPGVMFVAFQTQPVGLFVDKSVNATDNGAVPVVGVPLKLATGAGADTLMNVT